MWLPYNVCCLALYGLLGLQLCFESCVLIVFSCGWSLECMPLQDWATALHATVCNYLEACSPLLQRRCTPS